ncbi:MAG: hypothetical protein JXA11_03105 [Phycisphaerae bacterium]|nr:hypothetical protein [Phycisphaerae bacterium]
MRNATRWYTMLLLGLALCGCQSQDENPNWSPSNDYPDWAYDKPVYTEPAVEPKPYETVANGIDIYYSPNETFFIHHPAGRQEDIRPRTAVWFSYDGGNTWLKNGYYGLYQSFYTFAAEHEGQYWIRFVGPNMGVAEVPPGQPHEIHVVDTQPPLITMEVVPPPVEEVCVDSEGNEVPAKEDGSCCCCHTKVRRPHIYHVGEKVTVYWTVSDPNLESKTLELSTCFARFPHNLVWSRFKGKLAPSGSLEVVIPPEAASQAGMRFRMIAHDKAGNIGLGMSEIMDVQSQPEPARKETPTAEIRTVEKTETTVVTKTPTKKSTESAEVKTIEKEPVKSSVKPVPEPSKISKPKPKAAPLGLPEPPPDLTEPVNIETPADKPAPEPAKPATPEPAQPAAPEPAQPAAETIKPQSRVEEPTPILSLSERLAQDEKEKETPSAPPQKDAPAPVVKQESPKKSEPVAVKAEAKAEPEPAKSISKPEQAPTAKPTKTERSLAAMERDMETARQAKEKEPSPAKQPAQVKQEPSRPVAVLKQPEPTPQPEKSQPVPVKVLAKAPEKTATGPAWKPAPPRETPGPQPLDVQPVRETKPIASETPETAAADLPPTLKLSDIPESVQQGWPAKDMTLHGGVSRLLNWLPASTGGYENVELQFTSNDGKSWITVAKNLRPGRVATWTVPMVTSRTCLLRVVGNSGKDTQKTLQTSETFHVEAGKWETIDMSGFRMDVPKSK